MLCLKPYNVYETLPLFLHVLQNLQAVFHDPYRPWRHPHRQRKEFYRLDHKIEI